MIIADHGCLDGIFIRTGFRDGGRPSLKLLFCVSFPFSWEKIASLDMDSGMLNESLLVRDLSNGSIVAFNLLYIRFESEPGECIEISSSGR